jgi:hypothetical protein
MLTVFHASARHSSSKDRHFGPRLPPPFLGVAFFPFAVGAGRGRDSDNQLIVLLVLAAFFHSLLFFVDDGLAFLLGVRVVGR